ncbi:peptidoglycan editing factor PgeF [Candidatus Dependentiae bacterium]|nr:peptidoglycan editing factor PgeF [Candidatus Dependentiae bacterium]
MNEIFFNKDENFQLIQKSNVLYISSEKITKTYPINFGFTTRIGGVSSGGFRSLNLYFKNDDKNKVKQNFQLLFNDIGVSGMSIAASEQVHSNEVKFIEKSDIENDKFINIIPGVDGLITQESNLMLLSFYADCIPVFMFDKNNNTIGTIHSGWRSTSENIIKNAIDMIKKTANSKPENLFFAIGPSIDQDNFEVDEDVIENFKENKQIDNLVYFRDGNKYKIDLTGTLINQLLSEQIPLKNIMKLELSTFLNEELFYSFRRDGAPIGEHVLFAYKS